MEAITLKVSVIMSVFNGDRFVREALDSVVKDDFPDFELIVVNDGSTDNTANILNSYEASYRGIKVIHQENTGLTRALNVGLAAARGEYVARLDADDVSLPGRLAVQTKYMDQNREIALVGCNAVIINETGKKIGESSLGAMTHAKCMHSLERREKFFCHSSWMIRRDVFVRLGGYDEFFRKAQDFDLLLRLGKEHQMTCLPDRLIALRKMETTITYDNDYSQYKYATVALLRYMYTKRMQVERTPSLPMIWDGVSRWFTEENLGRQLAAQRELAFFRYEMNAARWRAGVERILRAFRQNPLFLVHWWKLREMDSDLPLLMKKYLPPLEDVRLP